jgi:hypothetical protein
MAARDFEDLLQVCHVQITTALHLMQRNVSVPSPFLLGYFLSHTTEGF